MQCWWVLRKKWLPIDESENVAEGDLSDADETTDDALMMEHLLENAKKIFLRTIKYSPIYK